VQAMVGDVLAVLDDIGAGAVHVLGATLGGIIAQDLAVRHPRARGQAGARLHLAGLAVGVPHAADDRVPDRGVQAVFLWTSRPLVISKTRFRRSR